MPHLIWSNAALADVRRLHGFLRDKSQPAADRAARTIQAAARKLIEFPRVGRESADAADVRELPIPFSTGGYLLYYRLLGDRIEVLWVRHQREQPRQIPQP